MSINKHSRSCGWETVRRFSQPASAVAAHLVAAAKRAKLWIWHSDLRLDRQGPQLIILIVLSAITILTWTYLYEQAMRVPGGEEVGDKHWLGATAAIALGQRTDGSGPSSAEWSKGCG